MADFSVFNIDFSKYEKSTGATRLPEGEYLMRVKDLAMTTVKNETSDNFGAPGIIVTLEVVNGPKAGSEVVDRLWVIEKALFRLDQFFSAFGIKIEKKQMNIPVQAVLNRTLAVTLKDGKPFGDNQTIKSEVKKYAEASSITGESKPSIAPDAVPDSGDEDGSLDASQINL